jgi:mono/diheme cytochrome c family protein
MSRNGMVAGVVVTALLAVCFSRFGGAQVPGEDRGHGDHGTPAGWRFTWPAGDPVRGRDAFEKYECFSCHEVRGEPFAIPHDAGNVGPELAAMGPAHQAEYFVEAIINPNAVIEGGKGYEAADGSSKMPSFNDTLTVQELLDLVAYLKALRPPPAPGRSAGRAAMRPIERLSRRHPGSINGAASWASPPQLVSACRSGRRPGQLLATRDAVRSVVFSRTCAELRELARELPVCRS